MKVDWKGGLVKAEGALVKALGGRLRVKTEVGGGRRYDCTISYDISFII